MNINKLEGLVAAPFTPLDENFHLDTEVIPEYAETLLHNGVSGAFIGGSSGEGISLSLKERKLLTEAWAHFEAQDFNIIVHVGSMNANESKELSIHAQKMGVCGIACMAPVFFQPNTCDELLSYCKKIAIEALNTPFYFYHIPNRTGVNVDMVKFIQKGLKEIPNFAGVKFTHSDMIELQLCLNLKHNLQMLYGCDESLLCGLSVGVESAIGTTYNFMPKLYIKMIEAFKKGDIIEARRFQLFAVKVIAIMQKYHGPIVSGKAIQALCGIDCGPCKLPLTNLTRNQRQTMMSDLKAINFFDYAIVV